MYSVMLYSDHVVKLHRTWHSSLVFSHTVKGCIKNEHPGKCPLKQIAIQVSTFREKKGIQETKYMKLIC